MTYTPDLNTCLSTYFEVPGQPQQIKPRHVNDQLKLTVTLLGLPAYGITPDLVSSHSLRAGGAMAMHLNGVPPLTIKKQGRWSSNTFMQYIHEQLGAFTMGVAARMSKCIPFVNMSAQTLNPNVTNPHHDNQHIPN